MLPWLWNVYMDGCLRKIRARVGKLGPKMEKSSTKQPFMAGFFIDDVLLAESVRMLQRVEDKFDRVYKRRELKVNVGSYNI